MGGFRIDRRRGGVGQARGGDDAHRFAHARDDLGEGGQPALAAALQSS